MDILIFLDIVSFEQLSDGVNSGDLIGKQESAGPRHTYLGWPEVGNHFTDGRGWNDVRSKRPCDVELRSINARLLGVNVHGGGSHCRRSSCLLLAIEGASL